MGIDFESSLAYANLIVAYKITMFAMWGLGVDLPRLLVRYAKSYPMVINIHCISMLMIGLLTFLYVIAKTSTFYSQIYPVNQYEGVNLA
jgi:phosphoglycerol transferase MdoB-like AlkP superfamily enzyme